MTQPAPAEDGLIHATVSLAGTLLGQKVAITLVVLLGRDVAAGVAKAVADTAAAMSTTGLVVATGNGVAPEV